MLFCSCLDGLAVASLCFAMHEAAMETMRGAGASLNFNSRARIGLAELFLDKRALISAFGRKVNLSLLGH